MTEDRVAASLARVCDDERGVVKEPKTGAATAAKSKSRFREEEEEEEGGTPRWRLRWTRDRASEGGEWESGERLGWFRRGVGDKVEVEEVEEVEEVVEEEEESADRMGWMRDERVLAVPISCDWRGGGRKEV